MDLTTSPMYQSPESAPDAGADPPAPESGDAESVEDLEA